MLSFRSRTSNSIVWNCRKEKHRFPQESLEVMVSEATPASITWFLNPCILPTEYTAQYKGLGCILDDCIPSSQGITSELMSQLCLQQASCCRNASGQQLPGNVLCNIKLDLLIITSFLNLLC